MYFRNRIPSQLAVDDAVRAPSELVLPVVTGPHLKVHQWLPTLLPGIRIVNATRKIRSSCPSTDRPTVIEDFLAHIAQEHVQKWLFAEPVTKIISLGFGPPIECSGFLCTVKTQSSPFLRPSQRSNDAGMRDFGMIRMDLEAFRTVWDSIIGAYSMRAVYTSFFATGIHSEYQGNLASMWCKLHQKTKLQTKAKALLPSTRTVLLTTLVLHKGFKLWFLTRSPVLLKLVHSHVCSTSSSGLL